jgi:hypothetical protein
MNGPQSNCAAWLAKAENDLLNAGQQASLALSKALHCPTSTPPTPRLGIKAARLRPQFALLTAAAIRSPILNFATDVPAVS